MWHIFLVHAHAPINATFSKLKIGPKYKTKYTETDCGIKYLPPKQTFMQIFGVNRPIKMAYISI